MYLRILSLALLLCCMGCQNEGAAERPAPENHWKAPPAGILLDKVEQQISEDKLNTLFFRVSIVSTELSREGVYQVMLEYGFNKHETQISLPDWPDHVTLRPELKAGSKPYQCYLGFDAGDGIFHELYEISVDGRDIHMRQSYNYILQNKNPQS